MLLCCLDLQVAAKHLSSRTINVGSMLDQESRMWLRAIYRRLAHKVGIRKPYQGEITRGVPIDDVSLFTPSVEGP